MTNPIFLKLKKSATIGVSDIPEIKAGTEFHIALGVVYLNGMMLQSDTQEIFKTWIENNPNLFTVIQ